MAEDLDVRLQRGIRKWEASGAKALGFPKPTDYLETDGRVADRLYRGCDDRGGYSIVQEGRVLHSCGTNADSEAYYREHFANPNAARDQRD